MSNKILLAPTSPEENVMVKDKTGLYHLLVEREQISIPGDQCNRIGTSYYAFNN
jgi:hypothetical protein